MDTKNIAEYITRIIQRSNRHPFLFIGSGFSKRYFNLLNWEGLLRKFAEEFSGDDFKFDFYKNKIDSSIPNILYPQIASLLEKDYNEAVFSDDKYKKFRLENKEVIQSGISPFKIALSNYFLDIDILSCENEEFLYFKNNISTHVAGVITTNYDLILDEIFNKFNIYSSQEELLFADIYNMGELYKIHGSASKPNSIIINNEDYEIFNKKYAYLTAKLLTIFLENPVIFIGYSLNDSNIQSILKSITQCLNKEQLQTIEDRLIFIEYSNEEETIKAFQQSFNDETNVDEKNTIPMTKITTNRFLEVYKGIVNTAITIKPNILRQLRKEIYELAVISNPASKIYAIGFDELDKLSEDSQLLLSIGVHKSNYGKSVTADLLYEDVIFNNKRFTPEFITKEVLPVLLKQNTSGLPMYKYIKDCKEYITDTIKADYEKKHSLDDFLNNSIRKGKIIYRKKLQYKTIDEIIKIEGMEKAFRKICFLNEDEINLTQLHSYIKEIYYEIGVNNSDLRRLIRIYDYLINRF